MLWTLTNYLYLHAIQKINTTDASVLFCCNKAFVFLLSWIVLRDRFMGVRVSAPSSGPSRAARPRRGRCSAPCTPHRTGTHWGALHPALSADVP